MLETPSPKPTPPWTAALVRQRGLLVGTAIVVATFTTVAWTFLAATLGLLTASLVLLSAGLLTVAFFWPRHGRPETWENSAIKPDQPLARYCAHCAAPNPIGSSYCSNCGDKL